MNKTAWQEESGRAYKLGTIIGKTLVIKMRLENILKQDSELTTIDIDRLEKSIELLKEIEKTAREI